MSEIDQLAQATKKSFDRVDKRFDALDTRLDKKFNEIDRRFDAIDKRFEKVDKRFEKLEQQIKDSEQRIIREFKVVAENIHKDVAGEARDARGAQGWCVGVRSPCWACLEL